MKRTTAKAKTVTIGQRVKPNGFTKNALTYGYVKNFAHKSCGADGAPCVYVYWPEIKSGGVWPVADLTAF